MTLNRKAALVFALAIVSMVSTGSAQAVTKIFDQRPCNPGGSCVVYNTVSGTMRDFQFRLPGKGIAQVTFHGTMTCYTSNTNDQVIDFASQIVTGRFAQPSQSGPGGLRHAAVLKSGGNEFGSTLTFNLASTRVIEYQTGGQKEVFFNLWPLRHDDPVQCASYTATFSVVFTSQ